MSFSIPREQQKVFVDKFMEQVLNTALQLVDEGRDEASPGATIYNVGQAVIDQLLLMQAHAAPDKPEHH